MSHRSNLNRQKSNFRCELALWLIRLRAWGDSTAERLDSVRPINRTPSGAGKSCASNARAAAPNWLLSVRHCSKDLLRVICRKSAYFTLRVTVRPTTLLFSILCHTLSITSSSASLKAVFVERSSLKVLSRPTDLRMRSDRTSLWSIPRAAWYR